MFLGSLIGMVLGMVIEEETDIRAPLPIVWQVFSGFDEWEDWNDACQHCHFVEGSEMSKGACVSFVVRPFAFPITVSPRITKCVPAQEVVWEGGRFGIHAVHSYFFREEKDKVFLLSVEKFDGPLLWLARLVFLPRRLHRLTKQLLVSMKQEAEMRYLAQKDSALDGNERMDAHHQSDEISQY